MKNPGAHPIGRKFGLWAHYPAAMTECRWNRLNTRKKAISPNGGVPIAGKPPVFARNSPKIFFYFLKMVVLGYETETNADGSQP